MLPIGCTGNPGTFSNDSEEMVSMNTVTVFGADLTKQLKAEGREIPLFVEKCIIAIENRGAIYTIKVCSLLDSIMVVNFKIT
jgi:hypothetical protein